ncbi:MAG: hypothetical protein JSR80_03785 [Verrucomicrobia bacterium]|nr:hypothetical protein [Verrucomicrobiota bacterium]
MAACIGIGLVASRFFKSFSSAHGAVMGALSGAGVTITIINLKVAPLLRQARNVIATQLRKAPLEEVEAIILDTKELLKNETLSNNDLDWLRVGVNDLQSYATLISEKEHSGAINEIVESLNRLHSTIETQGDFMKDS